MKHLPWHQNSGAVTFLFRSARTSCRTFDVHPSTRPATIFPEFIDELYHCRQTSELWCPHTFEFGYLVGEPLSMLVVLS